MSDPMIRTVKVGVVALPGFMLTSVGDDDEILVCSASSDGPQRSRFIDSFLLSGVLRDLLDGRPDMAAHVGYGDMWTLEVPDDDA